MAKKATKVKKTTSKKTTTSKTTSKRSSWPNSQDNSQDNTIAILIHLLNILTIFSGITWIVSLILWLVKRDESKFIDQEGKIWFNANISYLLYSIALFAIIAISIPLMIVLVGFITLPIAIVLIIGLTVLFLVESILAAIRIKDNQPPRQYYLAIEFLN